MTIAIIGLGLIGGSMALALKDKGFAQHLIGVESDARHRELALERSLVDEVLPLTEAVQRSALVILATPVDAALTLLPQILDLTEQQVVIDAGSTKLCLVNEVRQHRARRRYVATHPMWGTEFSGPLAATRDAFRGKATIICDREDSGREAVQLAELMYQVLGMRLVYMAAADHDVHVAYVSHISHITSFALANTVLAKEREQDAIFELASAGFESTVRLAKSNPRMWQPILKQNRDNVLDVLGEHILQLQQFKESLEADDDDRLRALMENANSIRKVLDKQ